MSNLLADVVRDVNRDLELRAAAEEERKIELTQAEQWARDPVGWLNSGLVWIASKFTAEGVIRPTKLALFPAQEQTVRAWIDLDRLARTGQLRFLNIAIEKSRQIGETWVFAAIICWAVHYHPVTGLAMHVDQGEIDDGGQRNTTKSLFGKVRYIDRRLDRGKVPGLGQLTFRPFSNQPAKIENQSNGSVVYGEGQGDDPGRGGDFGFVLVDEAAFVRHGEKVLAALSEACPNGKALLSTVNGDGNAHARICDQKPDGWQVLRLHWSEHPVYSQGLHVAGELDSCALCHGNRAKVAWTPRDSKAHRYPGKLTSPWYDQAVADKTDEQVANEYDIDRERALSARVYPEFSTEVHVVTQGIEYAEDLHIHTELAWDYGLDVFSVLVCQDSPAEYRVIAELEMGDEHGTSATPENVAAELRALLGEIGVPEALLAPSWTRRMTAVGDPSMQDRTATTARPYVEQFSRLGFEISAPPPQYRHSVEPSIVAVKRLLQGSPKPLRICGVKCPLLISHFRNNRWPTDRDGNRRVTATKPFDDRHNHALRAFAYLAVTRFPPPDRLGPASSGAVAENAEADVFEQPSASGSLAYRRRRQAGVNTGLSYGQAL